MIPLAGALISFAVNYVIVQVMGRAAVRWYARQTSSDAGGNVG
jgi:hypothetical protein